MQLHKDWKQMSSYQTEHSSIPSTSRPFTIQTDYRVLQWLDNIKDSSSWLTYWSLSLQSSQFKFEHRKGRDKANADTLSKSGSQKQCFAHKEEKCDSGPTCICYFCCVVTLNLVHSKTLVPASQALGWHWNRLNFYSSIASPALASIQPIKLSKNLTLGI